MTHSDITDEEIIKFSGDWNGRAMTYVIANKLRFAGYIDVKTSYVLRRLKKLEAAGKVRRVQSSYAKQICWQPDTTESGK